MKITEVQLTIIINILITVILTLTIENYKRTKSYYILAGLLSSFFILPLLRIINNWSQSTNENKRFWIIALVCLFHYILMTKIGKSDPIISTLYNLVIPLKGLISNTVINKSLIISYVENFLLLLVAQAFYCWFRIIKTKY
jgi:hypothetical protein